jgi:hypothetical protein
MAYWTRIIARDGLPLDVCTPGPALPSNLDVFSYVNPRTKERETGTCEVAPAWTGTPGSPTDETAVIIDWPRTLGTRVH